MLELIALIAFTSLLTGVALGWYLRRVNAWCLQCGAVLTCGGEGEPPIRPLPGRARPTISPYDPTGVAARMADRDAQWRRLLN
jgi:hypothetical protein